MSLKPIDWHRRYMQQARWTRELRRYLFKRAGIGSADTILEVGAGSGAVLSDFSNEPDLGVLGLDIDAENLSLASQYVPFSRLIQGDAHFLPFQTNAVHCCFCHYFLLWVSDPARIVREMLRVTKSGGVVMALAEPDYGGRIDFPLDLAQLGDWQIEALKQQGADPLIGRQLAGLFTNQGCVDVETGVLGGEWKKPPSLDDLNNEWAVLKSDLSGFISTKILRGFKDKDFKAWKHGERILYVPTFYSWGRVP